MHQLFFVIPAIWLVGMAYGRVIKKPNRQNAWQATVQIEILMRIFVHFGLILVLLFKSGATFADTNLSFPAIFSDGMVVQSGKPVPVWGWSLPGEPVHVWFKGKLRQTRANAEGEWRVLFPSSDPGGPFEIKIKTPGSEKLIREVFAGDVWLVSGEGHRFLGDPGYAAVTANGEVTHERRAEETVGGDNEKTQPVVRFFFVEKDFSAIPESDMGNEIWRSADDTDVSMLSRLLAQANSERRNVPVGIINALWENTPAQAWIDPRDQSHLDDFAEEAGSVVNEPHTWQTRFEKHRRNLEIRRDFLTGTEDFLSIGVHRKDYDEIAWPEIEIPFNETWTGIVWLRKSFEWRGSTAGSAVLSLDGLKDIGWVFINGQSLGEVNADNSQIKIPPGILKRGNNKLAMRLINADSGVVQFGRHGAATISSVEFYTVLSGSWKYNDVIEGRLPRILESPQRMAGVLYNGMIHPLKGYPVAGVIWIQGESNLQHATSYELLLKTLIYSWRLKWNELKLPFIVIQLPPENAKDEAFEGALAELRSAQQKALTLPYTGLAATIDLPGDVYGQGDFKALTERIWRVAESEVFNEKRTIATGPLLKKGYRKGSRVVLKFDAVGTGLMLGKHGETGFHNSGLELLGNDVAVDPRQVIVEGDSIILIMDESDEVVAVQYAWADNPNAAIYNSEGLPAAPFKINLK